MFNVIKRDGEVAAFQLSKITQAIEKAFQAQALDVKDIEEIYQYINQAGLNTTQDSIHFLPFWENGVRFFTIEGPNKEKIEFSQYL